MTEWDVEELAAFLAHAIVKHLDVWRRNGQARLHWLCRWLGGW